MSADNVVIPSAELERLRAAKENPGGYDPQTGRPISEIPAVERLSRLLDGPEVRRVVWQRSKRSAYIFYVLDPRTGEEAETDPVDDVLALSNVQRAIHSVTGVAIKVHRRNSEAWQIVQAAITDAAEVVEVHDDEGEEMHWRLGKYLKDRLSSSKEEAAKWGEPYEHDGRVHVYRPGFSDFLRQHFRLRAEKGEVNAAFHAVGFETVKTNYYDDGGVRRTRCYWASPQGWTR